MKYIFILIIILIISGCGRTKETATDNQKKRYELIDNSSQNLQLYKDTKNDSCYLVWRNGHQGGITKADC